MVMDASTIGHLGVFVLRTPSETGKFAEARRPCPWLIPDGGASLSDQDRRTWLCGAHG